MYTTLLHSGGVFEPTRQSAETHLCCRSNEMSAQLERKRVHTLSAFKTDSRTRLLRMSLQLVLAHVYAANWNVSRLYYFANELHPRQLSPLMRVCHRDTILSAESSDALILWH
jgi:hypothetical protein